MNKKFLLFFMAVLTAFSFVSCKDDDTNETDPNTPAEAEADYTVIFIGNMGENDEGVYMDFDNFLAYRENGKIGNNVNLTGVVKSTKYQDELKAYGYDGTVEFTLGRKTGHDINYYPSDISEEDINDCSNYVTFCKETNAKRVGGANYDLTSVSAISSVIKKAAKECPAKNYVLMLLGHGSGFNPAEEVPNANGYNTRACVIDEGTDTSITCDNLVAAINTSGVKIQTIFFQNCLMSTLENLSAYQHCADYALISSEVTSSLYMPEFIAGLTNVGTDTEKLKKMANSVVDYYIDVVNPDENNMDPPHATSHGFYDLSKMPEVLSVVKNVAAWYADAAVKDPVFVSSCIENVNCSIEYDSYQGLYYGCFLKAAIENCFTGDYTSASSLEEVRSTMAKNFVKIINLYASINAEQHYTANYTFAHLMKVTLDDKDEAEAKLDFATLQSLYSQYLNAIKSMAYIRANHVDKSQADYEYIYASPSISIFSLDEEHFTPGMAMLLTEEQQLQAADEFVDYIFDQDLINAVTMARDLFCGNPFAYHATYNVVKTNYCGSQFDKVTNWSAFLMKLQSNPSFAVNPSRIADKVNTYFIEHEEEILEMLDEMQKEQEK